MYRKMERYAAAAVLKKKSFHRALTKQKHQEIWTKIPCLKKFYFYFFKLTIQIQYLPICLRATFLQQHLKIFCKKIKHIRKFSLVLICKQSLIRDICPVQIIFCLVENVSNVQKNTSDKICSIWIFSNKRSWGFFINLKYLDKTDGTTTH